MHFFEQAKDLLIQESRFQSTTNNYTPIVNRNGPTYEIHSYKPDSASEKLSQRARPSACHDSASRSNSPRCYPGTRQEFLQQIHDWITRQSLRASCLWLLGPAGSGKSAIAQTLAENWNAQHLLAASFFFSRLAPGYEQLNAMIPTIAHQLSLHIPAMSPFMHQAIHRDPLIFTKSLRSQMERVITRPLRDACRLDDSPFSAVKVIVIDALDECGDAKDQQELVSLFMDALTKNCLPLLLFITSRHEPHIAQAFGRFISSNAVKQVVLKDDLSQSADIELYVRSRFAQLNNGPYRALDDSWPPSEEAIAWIMQRTSGQFLYASDVVEYVCCAPVGAEERLRNVMTSQLGQDALPRIDAVFKQVLESVRTELLDTVITTLAWLVLYGESVATTNHTLLLGNPTSNVFSIPWLSTMLALPPIKIFESFDCIRSLVDVPERPDSQLPLRPHHASLFDFLGDKTRCGELFFMDEAAAHGRIALCMCKLFIGQSAGLVSPAKAEGRFIYLAETVFRYHLPQARPTEDLVKSLVQLARFKPHPQTLLASSDGVPSAGLNTTKVPSILFACDTNRAIFDFLKNFHETHPEWSFRRFGLRKQLLSFWLFKIVLVRTCGKIGCSCASEKLAGPAPRT